MRKVLAGGAAILLALTVSVVVGSYLLDTRHAYERVRGKSKILASPFGNIEYTEGGKGPPVLVIHGGGGGYDQGELVVDAVLGDDFHWITPSRFGYLGSSMPASATWDEQAHAYAFLLDHLDIERVALVALSQGGPSALLLAAMYPERVSSLTCLSCGVVASTSADQAQANQKGDMLRTVFAHDFTYWFISKYFKRRLMGVLGASEAVVAGLTPEERSLIERIIAYMNPAAPRSAGVVLDNTAPLPGKRIASIAAPTLIVHAKDDLLQLYHNAEFAAANIPGAQLMHFETGGHVVVVVQREAIGAAIRRHIRLHADTTSLQVQ
ncbi:MAG TPA: alpha/beta hydrolase [Noviherbaspirillum sp.]|nr:alpha/beta hydrolase [Noviherbaspirillum sp.]